jgi:putative ABC transport system substrate-binding protein
MTIIKLFTLLSLSLLSSKSLYAEDNQALITINQFTHHPALDETVEGIKEGLSERKLNIDKEVKLIHENAQGNISTAVQVSKHLASLEPQVMIAIATPSAQTTLKARNNEDNIVAFVAVTDPEAAGLTKAKNIIGVTDQPPVEELLKATLTVLPNVKKLGIIYNSSEINSVNTIKALTTYASQKGIIIIPSVINSSNEVMTGTKNLIGNRVDLIYLPQDNTVVSGAETITKIANEHNIPVITNDPALIDKGAFLAMGCNYKQAGKQLGIMIADKLLNKKIKGADIQHAEKMELRVNQNIAEKLNLNVAGKLGNIIGVKK